MCSLTSRTRALRQVCVCVLSWCGALCCAVLRRVVVACKTTALPPRESQPPRPQTRPRPQPKGDLDADAAAPRLFVDLGLEVLVAQSYSKNLGLYGERVGALNAVVADKEVRGVSE